MELGYIHILNDYINKLGPINQYMYKILSYILRFNHITLYLF